MKKKPGLFIGATNQHEGKTTASLGILSGLMKRYDKVGFIKPVGQEHVRIRDDLFVDKDVLLFKKYFQLEAPYGLMSPIIFTRGFTKDYIDGKIDTQTLENKVVDSYQALEKKHDCMVVEGTGNLGVGSIAEMNNAKVASLLGLDLLLVTSGGIGSAFDLIALNKALCDTYGVRIMGVLLNRVLDNKREMVIDYMTRALKRWDIPLLGAIPYTPFLMIPSMNDFQMLFATKLISGEKEGLRRFEKMRLVATSVEAYQKLITRKQLVITPSTREDVILATLKAHWDIRIKDPEDNLQAGFIFTGSTPPTDHITKQIQKAGIPALYSAQSSFTAMKMISSFTAKIQTGDTEKIKEATEVMEGHIDFAKLLSKL